MNKYEIKHCMTYVNNTIWWDIQPTPEHTHTDNERMNWTDTSPEIIYKIGEWRYKLIYYNRFQVKHYKRDKSFISWMYWWTLDMLLFI